MNTSANPPRMTGSWIRSGITGTPVFVGRYFQSTSADGMRCYWSGQRFAASKPDPDGVMVMRYRAIADRDGEHDVAKKAACVFGSCVNPFVANLCLALGIRFDYVDLSSACRFGGRDIAGCE